MTTQYVTSSTWTTVAGFGIEVFHQQGGNATINRCADGTVELHGSGWRVRALPRTPVHPELLR